VGQAHANGIPLDSLELFRGDFMPPLPSGDDLIIPIPSQELTREETRLLDSLAQEHYGLSGAALMENAGYWAAREAFLVSRSLAERKNLRMPVVTVVCGRGNNG